MTAVQDIWHEAAGVWADRTADLRSTFSAPVTCDPRMVTKAPCLASAPGGVGPGAWARAFGEWSHNDGTAIVDPPAGALGKAHSSDVSYHQNIFRVQAGMDFAAQRMGYENFVFGVLVGAVNSKVDFVSGTNVKLDGGNLGAYATYLNHNFFTDALFMANILNVHYNQSALLNSAGTAVSFGGHIDMGYRFNFQQNWFAEPLGTIEAVYTDFSNVNLPGVGVNLNNEHARGRLGLRVGTSFVNGGYRIEPSLTGSIWHSFTDDNIAELTSGAYAIDLTDVNTHRTYGEIGGAVNIFEMGSRWSAFAKGDFRFATDYTAGSGKIGFRYNW